jgi:hypothetical protein
MVLREILAKFGIQFDNKALVAGNASIQSAIGSLHTFGKALVGGLAVFGIGRMVDHMAEWGDELKDTSGKLGISANDLLEWRHAAGQSGASAETLTGALAKLQKNAFEASTGSKEMAKDFKRLGVEVKKPNGTLKTGSELMQEVGAALGALENPSEKVALAMSLLGRSGKELLPLFNEGAEGMEGMRKEARDLFGDITDFVNNADNAKDAEGRFNLSLLALKVIFVRDIIPIVARAYNGFTNLIKGISWLSRETRFFTAVLTTLGGVITVLAVRKLSMLGWAWVKAFLVPIGIALLAAVAIGFVVLVVDDLIAMFTGGRSVIAEFIDSLFGVGAASNFVHGTKDAFEGLLATLRDAWKLTKGLWGALVGMVKLGFAIFPLLIDQVASTIAAKILGLIARFKGALADITATGAKVGAFFGLDFSKEAASTRQDANVAQARANSATVSARSAAAGIQSQLNQYTFNVTGDNPDEVAKKVMAKVKEGEEEQRKATMAALTQNVG